MPTSMTTSTTREDTTASNISKALSTTPYACHDLLQLRGGSVNYVYRGALTQPVPATEHSPTQDFILIKHSTDHLSCNEDFKLDVSRWEYEVSTLRALQEFKCPHEMEDIEVKTPRLLYHDEENHISAMEYVPSSIDLVQGVTLLNPPRLSPEFASAAGMALGRWLAHFHEWTSEPAQEELRQHIQRNKAMSDLKFRVEYGIILRVLESFPTLLELHGDTLRAVIASVQDDFSKTPGREDHKHWGPIHGDFCSSNVLLTEFWDQQPQYAEIFIIDWEYTQHGHRAYDLGHMIADLLERKHFAGSELATTVMEGFVKGYGVIDDEMAFRTAIHAGAHMIGWYTRRAPNAPLPAPMDVVSEFMEQATLFIVKAWQRDVLWFLNSPLACLFELPSTSW